MAKLFDDLGGPGQRTHEAMSSRFAQVALEQGLDASPAGLTYAVPQSLEPLQVGQRVLVPLGKGDKLVAGYVIEIEEHSELKRIKAVAALDEQDVCLPADLIRLAQWMSAYYCCPLGMVLRTMLPAAVKHGTGSRQEAFVGLTAKVPGEGEDVAAPAIKLTPLQKRVLEAARQQQAAGQAWITPRELADLAGARTVAAVKQLLDKGLLATQHKLVVKAAHDAMSPRPSQAPKSDAPQPPELELTATQQQAIAHLLPQLSMGFGTHLLLGVTGSGKTEVYLRVMEQVLAMGRSGIMLVPEIALTPQTVARFHQRFSRIAVLHSGLTAAQRHEQWKRIRRGEADVVVGARSAVFAPLPEPGIIIVDEEHEHSYKQDQLPRYHARDVAIKRAQLLGIPVLLGSATPSLESYHNATTRAAYHLIRMPERVAGLSMPRVEIVDLTQERRKRYEQTKKAGVHLLSLRLEQLLRAALEQGGQAMLLLNRRGYANYIACADQRCGWMMYCPYCDAAMVYHKEAQLPTGGVLRCHHCQAEQVLPSKCPQCSKSVTVFGLGTQRVEEELQRKFPGIRMVRMDSDTMRTGRDYHQTLDAFREGELDLLLGTQMIGKGLDFPNVRVVGVISADTSLHLPDFRASERTFQLVAQVAGRSGRGEHPGQVVVQTFSPHDPAILSAAEHDYEGFAKRELALRQQAGLPPITRMARIVVRDKDQVRCVKHARELADALREFDEKLGTKLRLRGPAPCPIARVAEHHRQQIELIAAHASALQQVMTALRNARLLKSDAHTAIDVDPVVLL